MFSKIIFILFLLTGCMANANDHVPDKSVEKGYVAPFKIFDDVYYVGDKWVSAYLFNSQEGLILIDTLEYPYSHWLKDNIAEIGFSIADVKTIIITHGHSDHVSGLGWLQTKTNASVVMSSDTLTFAKKYFENNPKSPQIKNKNIQLVTAGERISSEPLSLTVHKTPGHTKGAISIEFAVRANSKTHKGLVFGGLGTNFTGLQSEQKERAELYLQSVNQLIEMHKRNPFDINLANHPHRTKLFEKVQQRTDSVDPMIDPVGFSRFLKQLKSAGKIKLREILHDQESSFTQE